MNEIRINELIDRFFNCDLGGDDRAALERALLRSPQARSLFWRKAEIHEGLREWGLEHWDRLGGTLAIGHRPMPAAAVFKAVGRVLRVATIPLTLLVGSLVGMGVAWAVVPQMRAALTMSILLPNGGFEDDLAAGAIMANVEGDRLERLPSRAGAWAADRVRVCGAEQGIVPVEGRRMLALEKALPGPGDQLETRADSCNLFQIVDLASHRSRIARGGCTLTASAHVIDAGPARPVATDFVVRLFVFPGQPESIVTNWPETRLEAIATGTERVSSFGGQSAWRELTAQASLPKDASFVILQIDATGMDRTPGRPAAVFDRHYCDDVRLTLAAPTDHPTAN